MAGQSYVEGAPCRNGKSVSDNRANEVVEVRKGERKSVWGFILTYFGLLFILAIVAMLIYVMVRMDAVDEVRRKRGGDRRKNDQRRQKKDRSIWRLR